MHDGSCIGINYAHRFPKCFRSLHTLLGFSLCTSCRQFNLSLYQFIQFLTCTRIPCIVSHCENGLVRCCLYTGHTCASSSATASMVRQVSFDSAELLEHSPNTETHSTVAPIDLIPTAEICLSQQILAEMSSPTPPSDWLTQKPETLTRRHRPPCKI